MLVTVQKKLSPFAEKCIAICEDRKAIDLVVYDVSETSILADYYIICSGTSEPHIRGIASNLEIEFKADGVLPRAVEGVPESHWIIIDYSDVLIHIFHPETRAHYQIEALMDTASLVYPPSEPDE